MIRSVNKNIDSNTTSPETHRRILDSRHIIGRSSGWETFFITHALRRWVKSNKIGVHELEVYIENISGSREDARLEFEQASKTINEPLLVVFSDDISKHRKLEHEEELQEMLSHGEKSDTANPPMGHPRYDPFLHQAIHQHTEKSSETFERKKRSAHVPCHVERMFVDFREIGYDSWIISPKGYSAGRCVGSCDFPFSGLSVSPHGLIQYQMHNRFSAQVEKPCCVPTKLAPISLLYYEKSSLIYKYNYEGMKVIQCGCR